MKAVVTGATGLVGSQLIDRLDQPVVLSRHPEAARRTLGDRVRTVGWSPEAGPAPSEALDGSDVVFHLAGESVAEGRWSDEKKRRIRDSRTLGTRNLVAGLERASHRPKVLVAASAVGIYADRGDEILSDTAPRGEGFLADVCAEWEREAMAAERLGIRVVCLRIGIVLAPNGGALGRMLLPFKLGAGGRLGSGRQWMPWIHLDDVVGLALHAASTASLHGPINATAPTPVTNAEFTKALAHALHRPALFPVPVPALKLAFGEMAGIMLASQRAVPDAALASGYRFAYDTIGRALDAIVHPSPRGKAA